MKPVVQSKPKKTESVVADEFARWEQTTLKKTLERSPERQSKFMTTSSMPIERLYAERHLAGRDPKTDLGVPGEFPFTRGIHPTMYRGKLWTMRQFAGFATPEETNARYHYLLKHGQMGLSVAMDMPTLYGYDADDAEAEGEVGVCGVNISSLKDMEAIFKGIPVGDITTSMTINGPAAVVWAMYLANAEKQGVPYDRLGGTTQNDILKEYIAQKEFLFPPLPSMRLVTDTVEFGTNHVPRWNTISISGYHIREAGSTAVQELAFTLADGMEYARWAIKRGLKPDAFLPRFSFFFNAHNDIFEEIAKYRAARRIWSKWTKEELGAKDPRSWMLRFHTQTAGCSATAEQAEINIVRTAYQALAAVLGGTQSLHTNSYDEALALPSEKAVRIALRTQQILAHESGVANTVDPLAGSYFIESLTNTMEDEANKIFKRIGQLGGVIPAIEKGYFQKELAEAAFRYQREIDKKERIIVGVNEFTEGNEEKPSEGEMLKIDFAKAQKVQTARLNKMKSTRGGEYKKRLADLRHAAEGDENLMPHLIKSVEAYATLQEICDVFRDVWGTYREKPMI
jgi:methylmalonyl-CoA mutase N-terminal domain/subunit